jgi:hypothetical protein
MDRDLRLVWLYCVIEGAVRQILGGVCAAVGRRRR